MTTLGTVPAVVLMRWWTTRGLHTTDRKSVFSYMRRWMIEQAFRFNKSELALESPRLWFWDNRLKLMAIVSLVYDFLLQMV